MRDPPERKRAQGMPGEGLNHGFRAMKKSTGKEPQVQPDHPAFPARWLYNLYVISLGTGLSCPHRLAHHPVRSLTSASGGQDHTISPYAPATFVEVTGA